MSAVPFTRREAAAAALASAALWAYPAAARPAAAGIHVDVGPLAQTSGEPTASWVARELPAALAAAGLSGPLSIRIDYVILGPNTGGAGPAGSSPDQMIGEVTRGGVSTPLRASSAYYPSPVDNTMIERSNFLRVSQLCRVFAEWVARGY